MSPNMSRYKGRTSLKTLARCISVPDKTNVDLG